MYYRVHKAKKCRGRWQASGDKSLTHRAFLLNAMAEGVAEIRNANAGEDCERTRHLLEALGVRMDALEEKHSWRIEGCAGKFRAPEEVLDAGNSGTTIRLLSGLLASQAFESRLDGDESLRNRPMVRIQQPLEALGAKVHLPDSGTPPFVISGASLQACDYESHVSSAQVKSAFLLAAMRAEGESRFREPVLSRDHTERMLQSMGVQLHRDAEHRIRITGPQLPVCVSLRIPGDVSSVAFLAAAATLVEGGSIVVKGLSTNPSRTGMLSVLERMGGRFAFYHPGESAGEPFADILIQHASLKATEISAGEIPSLIDEVPVIAALASRALGETRIHGLGELRFKESDRLEKTLSMLQAFHAKARVEGDSLFIEGPSNLQGCEFDSEGDHRMAMAASVMALLAKGETRIHGVESVKTSFPEFPGLIRRFTNRALEVEEER